MKKINIICSILLFICSLLVLCAFTIFNKHFIQHVFDKNNYYELIYNNIKKDNNINIYNYELDYKDVKKDLNSYISSKYSKKFNTKIELKELDTDKIYNKYIQFDGLKIKNKNIIIYLIEIFTLILIFVTANAFTSNKSKIKIYNILVLVGILCFILYGILYFSINLNNIYLSSIFHDSLKILLGYSIFLIELSIFYKLKIMNKLNKFFKKTK